MKQCPICSQSFEDHEATCPHDGVRLIELREWAPQTTVRGKYRILGKLGAGGMGVVYKAQHLILEELRALKVMSPELARDTRFVRRFRQEAQVTRRLRHPNIVQVDDLDQADDGSLFIAMELVDGVSLRQLLERTQGPLPLVRALEIARGIAEALEAAHALGLVHRDIKPDNVLLARDASGRDIPKVLDFGIVAMKESSEQLSSHPLLTPGYAPPEQWSGMKGSELDGRADLYALGMTLYEMLTGKTAFQARTHEGWMLAHLQTEASPPSAVNAALPPDVDRLVLRLLAKDRERRTPTAREFIEELKLVEAQSTWGQQTVAPRGPLPSQIVAGSATPTPSSQAHTPKDAVGATAVPVVAKATAVPSAMFVPPDPMATSGPRLEKSPQGDEPRASAGAIGRQGSSKGRRGLLIVLSLVVVALGVWLARRAWAPESTPPPTITLSAYPETVERNGDVRIRWAVKDADTVVVEPAFETRVPYERPLELAGSLQSEGALEVIVRGTTTYRLVASGRGGRAERTLTIPVRDAGRSEGTQASPTSAQAPPPFRPSAEAVRMANAIGVRPIQTIVETENAYRRMKAIRSLGSRGPGDESGATGGAVVVDYGGTLFLQGTRRREEAQLVVRAMITRLNEDSFDIIGEIGTQDPSVNGGQPCWRKGRMTFHVAQDGRSWRLTLPSGPCGNEIVELFFDVPHAEPEPRSPATVPAAVATEPAPVPETRTEPPRSNEPAKPEGFLQPNPGQILVFQGTYGADACEISIPAGNRVGQFGEGRLKIHSATGDQVVPFRVAPSNSPTYMTLQDSRGCRLTVSATLDSWGWPERLSSGKVVEGSCPKVAWEAKRVK